MVAKDYESWFPIKEKLDGYSNAPSFKEREVWWTHIGVNVGYEIFGKGVGFTRPVLIIRKYSNFTFLGAPLSTTPSKYKNQVPSKFKGKEGTVRLDQLRTFDARRLVYFMGHLNRQQFEEIRTVLREEF